MGGGEGGSWRTKMVTTLKMIQARTEDRRWDSGLERRDYGTSE